jgi:hypothetical protein
MRATAFIVLGVLFMLLTACAKDVYIPITEKKEVPRLDMTGAPILDETGFITTETVEVIAGYTKDASTFKEHEVHETLRNRDNARVKAAAAAGFKMNWTAVEETIHIQIPGQLQPTVITMTKHLPSIAYAPEVEFGNPLPTEPSEHPGWKTATTFVKWGFGTALGMYGLSSLNDMWNTGIAAAGGTFVGDGYKFANSFNQTSKSTGVSFGGGEGTAIWQNEGEAGINETPSLCPEDIACSCETWLETAGTCIQL